MKLYQCMHHTERMCQEQGRQLLHFWFLNYFPLTRFHIVNRVRAITPKLYGIYSWNFTSACITLIRCVMNSLFIRGKYIWRIYASTFHCYLYCESNFQLLDDKEYWTFIFWFNLKDCLLPYLVLCCLTNFCQMKSKFMFYYHSAYWLKQRFSLKNDIYLNNNFMVYLLQLHINPFSEWHLAGASVSYGHFF